MSGPVGTRVVVRTVVDWDHLDADGFAHQVADGRPLDHIRFVADRGGLELWSDTFGLDFFEFRGALRRIAESNLRALHGVEISFGLDDMSWFDDGDEYIFPIDDDDLFHPDLAERASVAAGGLPVTLWPATQFITDGLGAHEFRELPIRSFATNNGGLRSSFLREHFTRGDARTITLRHERATQGVARALGIEAPQPPVHAMFTDLCGPLTFFSPAPLSLAIKHPGSLTQLEAALRSDDPVRYLRRGIQRARVEIPPAFAWAEPWVRQVEDLLAALDPS